MIKSEKINFLAKKTAPNPQETTYWIDLTEDPNGGIIKHWNGKEWIAINGNTDNGNTDDIEAVLNQKADKATTLSGYGINDAYTITQTNSTIDTKVAALVDSAPETLNTLNELAAALGDDPNFATTVSNQIGLKANTADVYSKSDIDGKGFATTTQLNSKVSGTGVTNMQVVTELPSSPDTNTLYIITAA